VGRIRATLRAYVILGCGTNLDFLLDILAHEKFQAGETTTEFIPRYFGGWHPRTPVAAIVAASCLEFAGTRSTRTGEKPAGMAPDPWDTLGRWRLGGADA
jgi:acetyl/propionyl-CoA carboxylase alpha subunit